MSSITEQNVLKAFYQFDTKGFEIPDSSSGIFDKTARIKLCHEWLDAFDELDKETFEEAVKQALDKCKSYPTLEEMYDFIAAVQIGNVETVEATVNETAPKPVPEQPKPLSSREIMREKVLRQIAIAKAEGFAKVVELCKDEAEQAAITQFAIDKWDAPAEWIKQNWQEIETLYRQELVCSRCGSMTNCRNRGYCFEVPRAVDFKNMLNLRMRACFIRKQVENDNVQ